MAIMRRIHYSLDSAYGITGLKTLYAAVLQSDFQTPP
jgi:hypothetical protein